MALYNSNMLNSQTTSDFLFHIQFLRHIAKQLSLKNFIFGKDWNRVVQIELKGILTSIQIVLHNHTEYVKQGRLPNHFQSSMLV